MDKLISKLLTLTCFITLCGCAASYKPINPVNLSYNSHDSQNGISISYKYDVLRERGNKKYAKKENKKGVKLIALKITNNTESVINIGRNAVFYSGQNQMNLMEPMVVKESIKQIVPSYLPYLLLTFVNLTTTKSQNGMITEQNVIPVGLILGPGITLGNMLVAGTANNNLVSELYLYNILGKDIKSGETVYAIVGVRDMGYNPISIRKLDRTMNSTF